MTSSVIASFATIAGVEIKDFDGKYDKWKSPIFQCKNTGLDKKSCVKANNIATVDANVLIKKIILVN